ncbi:MAG TPA: hypothetical protein VL754_01320 [Verrucomicrobiae bacterium]|nr:hypothetical protein [Verrucomicrobiae bacterium]
MTRSRVHGLMTTAVARVILISACAHFLTREVKTDTAAVETSPGH